MSTSRIIRKAANLVSEVTQTNVYIIWYDREDNLWGVLAQNEPGFVGHGGSPEAALQDLRATIKSGEKND